MALTIDKLITFINNKFKSENPYFYTHPLQSEYEDDFAIDKDEQSNEIIQNSKDYEITVERIVEHIVEPKDEKSDKSKDTVEKNKLKEEQKDMNKMKVDELRTKARSMNISISYKENGKIKNKTKKQLIEEITKK